MAEKFINTRIALRIDSYDNWIKTDVPNKGGNLVLNHGEIGLCEIPGEVKSFVENGKTVTVETAPTILFKVGNSEKKPFKELPWASAKAADVYDWAKKPEEEFITWLNETAKFATDDEVEAIRSTLAENVSNLDTEYKAADAALSARLDNVEANLGLDDTSSNNSFSKRLENAEAAITTLTGENTVDGSVKNAIKQSNAYTDTREAAITAAYKAYADTAKADAVTSANSYTDGQVDTLEAKDAELSSAISDETAARESGDTALGERLEKVEAFFEGAYAEDGKPIKEALDTLVEIQNFITGEGTAANELFDAIRDNATAIEGLQGIVNDGGTLEVRVDSTEAAIARIDGEIDGHDTKIANLETFRDTTVPSTYETIANVNLVRTDVSDLKTLTTGADGNAKLREDLNALDTRVSTAESTLATTTTTAATASATATANAGRLDALEGRFGDDILVFYCGTSTDVIQL